MESACVWEDWAAEDAVYGQIGGYPVEARAMSFQVFDATGEAVAGGVLGDVAT